MLNPGPRSEVNRQTRAKLRVYSSIHVFCLKTVPCPNHTTLGHFGHDVSCALTAQNQDILCAWRWWSNGANPNMCVSSQNVILRAQQIHRNRTRLSCPT